MAAAAAARAAAAPPAAPSLSLAAAARPRALRWTVHPPADAEPTVAEPQGTLDALRWDHRGLRALPLDRETKNETRQVRGAIFSRVAPTPLESPRLVAVSRPALALLGLRASEAARADAAALLSGSAPLAGADPAAHCYAGHQFGAFSGQLGDGAAILLGEIAVAPPTGAPPGASTGEAAGDGPRRERRIELQLKGSGLTPFSRTADGRKVLRSSLREFLGSEALAALGVPTVRSASLVTSDTRILRDPF
jgi:serine/tyrosine/threonine adenylyltransferase